MLYSKPDWAKDQIRTNITVHLDWKDRLSVLFGGIISLRVKTNCESIPGPRLESETEVSVYRERRTTKATPEMAVLPAPSANKPDAPVAANADSDGHPELLHLRHVLNQVRTELILMLKSGDCTRPKLALQMINYALENPLYDVEESLQVDLGYEVLREARLAEVTRYVAVLEAARHELVTLNGLWATDCSIDHYPVTNSGKFWRLNTTAVIAQIDALLPPVRSAERKPDATLSGD